MCGAFAFLVMDKKAPGCETLAVRRLPALVHSKLPSLSTPDVENRGGADPFPRERAPTPISAVGPWTEFHHASKRLRCNARAHLSTPSSHRSPRPVWKTIEGHGQKITTSGNARTASLAATCPHQVPIAFHARCGKPAWPALVVAHLGGRVADQCPPRWASTRARFPNNKARQWRALSSTFCNAACLTARCHRTCGCTAG